MKYYYTAVLKVPTLKISERGFITRKVDLKDKYIKSLCRWNPFTAKAEYRVKLVDNNGASRRYTLTKVDISNDRQWITVYWNPNEAIDALKSIIPMMMVTIVAHGFLSQLIKSDNIPQ